VGIFAIDSLGTGATPANKEIEQALETIWRRFRTESPGIKFGQSDDRYVHAAGILHKAVP
jgi:hypothetical protein